MKRQITDRLKALGKGASWKGGHYWLYCEHVIILWLQNILCKYIYIQGMEVQWTIARHKGMHDEAYGAAF